MFCFISLRTVRNFTLKYLSVIFNSRCLVYHFWKKMSILPGTLKSWDFSCPGYAIDPQSFPAPTLGPSSLLSRNQSQESCEKSTEPPVAPCFTRLKQNMLTRSYRSRPATRSAVFVSSGFERCTRVYFKLSWQATERGFLFSQELEPRTQSMLKAKGSQVPSTFPRELQAALI